MTVTRSEAWERQRSAVQPFAARVAAEVRAMMGRRGMTQTMLAAELGVTQMYVSRRVKQNDPTPMDVEDLMNFARILDCSITDLLPAEALGPVPAGSSVATLKYATPLRAVA